LGGSAGLVELGLEACHFGLQRLDLALWLLDQSQQVVATKWCFSHRQEDMQTTASWSVTPLINDKRFEYSIVFVCQVAVIGFAFHTSLYANPHL
jgi:hypothetical protein